MQKKIDIEGMSQAQLIRKTKHEGMVAISDALDLLESREFSLQKTTTVNRPIILFLLDRTSRI